MASLHRQIALDAPAATVWAALRDLEAVHRRVAPGFLTGLRMEGGDRIVTFFNGLVAMAAAALSGRSTCCPTSSRRPSAA
jgi:hypothetical protein